MSYKGVKSLISQYKKPFNKEKKALAKAKARLKEEGRKATSSAVEEEKLVVLSEWHNKTLQGEEAHKVIIERRFNKYPDSIVGEYTKREDTDAILDAITINKLEIGSRYFEKLIVDNQNKVIGYADQVYVDNKGYIHIEDFKTHNEIRRTFTARGYNGFVVIENYFHPISDLVVCNYNDCALQASFYMYILWTYNKKLKPGRLTMLHAKLDEDSGKIISEETYELPYLLNEVKSIIQYEKEIKV